MEIFHIRHLDHKEYVGPTALPDSLGKPPQVLGSTLRGRIGKGADAAILQGHALDLQITLLSVLFEGKIKPGIPVYGFRPQIGDLPQTAGGKPFPGCRIGGLGVHIDEPAALFYRDQVVGGFPLGVIKVLAEYIGPLGQQLPAPARVFYMDDLLLTADLHMGDKPVGPT